MSWSEKWNWNVSNYFLSKIPLKFKLCVVVTTLVTSHMHFLSDWHLFRGDNLLITFIYTSTILYSRADSLCSYHMWFSMTEAFYSVFLNVHRSGVLTALFGCYMADTMWNYCCLNAHSVYTIQPCTSLQCHFVTSHLHRVHVCLAVTCHLHFWQSDRDFLCATAVTQGGMDT